MHDIQVLPLFVDKAMGIYSHSALIDFFTVPLHRPNACRWGCAKGLSLGSEKRWKFPLVTWAHNAILIYIQTTQSQKSDASQLEVMSHTPLTVLLPPGWDCVAVYSSHDDEIFWELFHHYFVQRNHQLHGFTAQRVSNACTDVFFDIGLNN